MAKFADTEALQVLIEDGLRQHTALRILVAGGFGVGKTTIVGQSEHLRNATNDPPDTASTRDRVIGTLSRALEAVDGDAIVLVGTMLFVKHDGVLQVFNLPSQQLALLDANPHLLAEPSRLLQSLT
ncbi:hypothetical protein [Nonomuraea angiospora]|uniref:hypothetical protein n=1 Tax=Nonomuraea angiospora TaxID=46172 RepID=UPI00299F9D09|nr:hypothetical protein [Nonomuraea angiospora]MDX3111574.1 hypothetical protein [Nonomuraea angiospora]